MTSTFKQIEDWINGTPSPEGWGSAELGKALASCAFAIRPDVCVEIGIFGGRSLIPVALALREIGKGMIIGIDPWSASANIEGQTPENAAWWNNQEMMNRVYNGFLESVNRFGVQNCVRTIRKKSDDFPVPDAIDLLVVDGNHGPQALVDIKRFTPKVRVGGFVYLDDINWEGLNVAKGAAWMKENGFISLYGVDSRGEMFQRIK